jgi:hypothetical protein
MLKQRLLIAVNFVDSDLLSIQTAWITLPESTPELTLFSVLYALRYKTNFFVVFLDLSRFRKENVIRRH